MSTPAEATVVMESTDLITFGVAFDDVREEMEALAEDRLVAVNLDVPSAVVAVLGREPGLQQYRKAILKDLPNFDIGQLDRLQIYARALGYAHTLYTSASKPLPTLQPLARELTSCRQTLVSDISALARRRLLDDRQLAEMVGGTGYKSLAFDVMLLIRILRDHWSTVGEKSAVTLHELDRAELLATELTRKAGFRDRSADAKAKAQEKRQRAFTLFANAYDEVRRALVFLRWQHDDVDLIAPSLHARRHGGIRGALENK